VSLLSIASRHHQHRSHNALSFHHGKALERQLPADAQHDIHGPHGTRVTVRNLFGNLPVRVKQRSKVVEHKAENGRLWEQVKANVTALLLSWPDSVSLRARDTGNRVVFAFNTSDPRQKTQSTEANLPTPRSGRLTSMLNILTQANYISIHQWSSWVPVSASTTSLAIKGAISLEPMPSRSVQFISLGSRPLSADSNYNELYDEINRLFSLSIFGSIEDGPVIEHGKLRQKADKQSTRKSVDRCPMFYLHISFWEGLVSRLSEDQFSDNKSNVETILEVLGAMITQWLSAHHLLPNRLRQKPKGVRESSIARLGSSRGRETATLPLCPPRDCPSSSSSNLTKSNPTTTGAKTGRPSTARSAKSSERLENRAFANWSRIKSGKSDFFSNHTAPQKPRSAGVATSSLSNYTDVAVDPFSKSVASARPSTQFLAQGALGAIAPKEDGPRDETILWIDPVTKATRVLNARTGCMIPLARTRPATVSSTTTLELPRAHSNSSLRPTLKTTPARNCAWLDGILKDWDNPIFKPSEQCIEQVVPHEPDSNNGPHRPSQHRCSHFGGNISLDTLPTSMNKLSKESLASAGVVAQVDKKFILIKTPNAHVANTTQDAPKMLLVLVDQHAADERIRVETLFRQLCSPPSPSCSSYQSKLGHAAQIASTILEKPIKFTISQHERFHFAMHAKRFAFWGILFDITETTELSERTSAPRKTHCLLSVTSLPLTIAERCRMDIELLISFLRSTVWKYASDSTIPSHTRESKSPDWVARLATCPEGLIDMINSRACRSAIMFNDELDLNQCGELIRKLADCVFPFMCAHGRPSLVPLVEVGKLGQENHEVYSNIDTNIGDYVRKWKQWKC
jgi:DNA mismatch repair protein MLH3